ncbi:hypothetical protein ABZ468_42930 [Streptomyces sp. NPDC005708]|uniref:hypothetical protein n=1 Tax=Streptomyces sp. NPDC005708 TaxID=3154564 RepID=UPI0033CD1A01
MSVAIVDDAVAAAEAAISKLEAERKPLAQKQAALAKKIAALQARANEGDLDTQLEVGGQIVTGQQLDADLRAQIAAIDTEIAQWQGTINDVRVIADFRHRLDALRTQDEGVRRAVEAARTALLEAAEKVAAAEAAERATVGVEQALQREADDLQHLAGIPGTVRVIEGHWFNFRREAGWLKNAADDLLRWRSMNNR